MPLLPRLFAPLLALALLPGLVAGRFRLSTGGLVEQELRTAQ